MSVLTFILRLKLLSPLIAVVLLGGCSYGPEQTVTIEITGELDDAEQEQIIEKLKTMTDGSSHSMSSFSSGNSTTIELAPVGDVQAFADKIDFGEVTAVEGRTVKVSVGDDETEGEDSDSADLRRFGQSQAA